MVRATGGREILEPLAPELVDSAARKLRNEYHTGSFIVDCFYIGFDGVQFGHVNETFQIPPFEGYKELTTLPIYPFSSDPDRKITEDMLLKRGKKFASLANPHGAAHRQYIGLTMARHPEQVSSTAEAP